MRPFTSQFSASVGRRDHVVKKTWVGAVPRTAAVTASRSSRSAVRCSTRASRFSAWRLRPETNQPSDRSRWATLPPLMPVTPTTSARPPVTSQLLGSCSTWHTQAGAAHLAVDERGGDDQTSLEDVLPLLIETEEDRRVQDL